MQSKVGGPQIVHLKMGPKVCSGTTNQRIMAPKIMQSWGPQIVYLKMGPKMFSGTTKKKIGAPKNQPALHSYLNQATQKYAKFFGSQILHLKMGHKICLGTTTQKNRGPKNYAKIWGPPISISKNGTQNLFRNQ